MSQIYLQIPAIVITFAFFLQLLFDKDEVNSAVELENKIRDVIHNHSFIDTKDAALATEFKKIQHNNRKSLYFKKYWFYWLSAAFYFASFFI